MKCIRAAFVTVAAAALWACGGEPAEDEARDLSLVPAESTTVLDDAPQPAPAAPRPTASQPTARPPAAPSRPTTTEPADEPARAPRVARGTAIELAAVDSIDSDHNQVGDVVTATAVTAVTNARGRTLIPAGAVFSGTITDISAADNRLVLQFTRVSFGGNSYDLQADTDSVGAETRTDEFKAGDAAKIGAGAVVGAVAGRLIGKNAKGTVIGGVAGAAAGTGIALATRGDDLVLPAGGLIRIVLARPLVLERRVS